MNEYITPDELLAELAGAAPPVVIDVRGEEEFRAGHLAGARHIFIDELAQALPTIPKDRPLVTY